MWVGCGSVCWWRRIEGVDDGEGFVERCVGGVGGEGRCRENCRLCRLGYGVGAEREGIGRMWVAVVLWLSLLALSLEMGSQCRVRGLLVQQLLVPLIEEGADWWEMLLQECSGLHRYSDSHRMGSVEDWG